MEKATSKNTKLEKAVADLTALEELTTSLSDDLASRVDDGVCDCCDGTEWESNWLKVHALALSAERDALEKHANCL